MAHQFLVKGKIFATTTIVALLFSLFPVSALAQPAVTGSTSAPVSIVKNPTFSGESAIAGKLNVHLGSWQVTAHSKNLLVKSLLIRLNSYVTSPRNRSQNARYLQNIRLTVDGQPYSLSYGGIFIGKHYFNQDFATSLDQTFTVDLYADVSSAYTPIPDTLFFDLSAYGINTAKRKKFSSAIVQGQNTTILNFGVLGVRYDHAQADETRVVTALDEGRRPEEILTFELYAENEPMVLDSIRVRIENGEYFTGPFPMIDGNDVGGYTAAFGPFHDDVSLNFGNRPRPIVINPGQTATVSLLSQAVSQLRLTPGVEGYFELISVSAIGQNSGNFVRLEGFTASSGTVHRGPTIIGYKTEPLITIDADTPNGIQAPGTNKTLLTFTVDASGIENNVQLHQMQFDLQFPEDSTLRVENMHLEDENGVTVSTGIGGGGRPGFSSGGFALNEQYVLSGSPKTYQLKADVLLAPGAVPGRSTLKAGITEGGTLWSYDDVAETFSFDRYQYPRLEGRWLMF